MTYINDVKRQARILKDFLKEHSISINHSLALEATAKINGFKDWNTMSSISIDTPKKINSDSHFNLSNFKAGYGDEDILCLNIYLLIAIKYNNIEQLLSVGADTECVDDLCEKINFNIKPGEDGWKQTHPGSTPLILAAKYNLPEIVKILLRYKANVNAKDPTGRTALDWAYQEGHLEVSRILIDFNNRNKV